LRSYCSKERPIKKCLPRASRTINKEYTVDMIVLYAAICSLLMDRCKFLSSSFTSIMRSSYISRATPVAASLEESIKGRGKDHISFPIDCNMSRRSIAQAVQPSFYKDFYDKSSPIASKCLSHNPRTLLGSPNTNIVANNLRIEGGIAHIVASLRALSQELSPSISPSASAAS
jgi:hypothetical protein